MKTFLSSQRVLWESLSGPQWVDLVELMDIRKDYLGSYNGVIIIYYLIPMTNMSLKPPCELVVSRIIPALRASLVKQLVDEHGMTQIEISEVLGITQPAVSQYMNQRRGGFEGLKSVFPEIDEYTKKIAEQLVDEELTQEDIDLCIPCKVMRNSDVFCPLHRDYSGLPSECKICDERGV